MDTDGYHEVQTKHNCLRESVSIRGRFLVSFWLELTFAGGTRMAVTANCYRCQSIMVDYLTGNSYEDDRGQIWKKLHKDRRVNQGAKYSPVFGDTGSAWKRSWPISQWMKW